MRPPLPPPAAPRPLFGAVPRPTGPPSDGISLADAGDGLTSHYLRGAEDPDRGEDWRDAASLFALAEGDFQAGCLDEAFQGASDALELFRGAGDASGGGADALRLMLHCLAAQGKRGFAEAMASEELALLEAAGAALAAAKLRLALAELALGRPGGEGAGRGAVDLASAALETCRSLGDELWEARAELTLCCCHLRSRLGDLSRCPSMALAAADRSLALARRRGDAALAALALHGRAAALAAAGELEEALAAAEQALAAFRAQGRRCLEAVELMCMALWQLEDVGSTDVVTMAEEAVAICQAEQSCRNFEVAALAVLVRAAGVRGDVAVAQAAARRAMRQSDAAGDEADAVAVDAAVAGHLLVGDAPSALKVVRRALRYTADAPTSAVQCFMLLALADLQLVCGQADKARSSAETAESALQALGDLRGSAHAALQRARAEIASEGLAAAALAVEDARQRFAAAGDAEGQSLALLQAAAVDLLQQDFGAALAFAEQAAAACRGRGDLCGEAAAATVACLAEAKRQAFPAALAAARRAAALLESGGPRRRRRLAEALLLCAQMGVRVLEGGSLADAGVNGVLATASGQEDARLETLRDVGEALSLGGELGDLEFIGSCQVVCSRALVLDGRADEALAEADEALRCFRGTGSALGEAAALEAQAAVLLSLGRREPALAAAELARDIFEQVGDADGAKRAAVLSHRIRPSTAAIAGLPGLPEGWPAGLPPHLALQALKWQQAQGTVPELGQASAAGHVSAPPAPEPQKPPRPKRDYISIDLTGKLTADLVLARLQQMMHEGMGIYDCEDDMPLLQAGLTSSNAIMLTRTAAADFPQVKFPPTLVFDFPSLRAISEYVIDSLQS